MIHYNKNTIINGLKMLKEFLNMFKLNEFVCLLDATIHFIERSEDDIDIYMNGGD